MRQKKTLIDQADALKTVGALFFPVKEAAVGAHLSQQPVFLADKQIDHSKKG